MTPRQIWANPTSTSTKTYASGCTPFILPSNGMCFVLRDFRRDSPLLDWRLDTDPEAFAIPLQAFCMLITHTP